jgi:hypothetical protein
MCALPQAQAKTATTTSIAIKSGGGAVTTVTAGSILTLTATVTAGSAPVTPGLVKFCDATAKYCEDIHIVETAQLIKTGTATVRLRPGIGTHSYTAVFAGTNTYDASSSSAAQVAVAGTYPTATTITSTGGLGSYGLTATVTGTGLDSPPPTGTVSFLDTSNSNAILGTATLISAPPTLRLFKSANPKVGYGPNSMGHSRN